MQNLRYSNVVSGLLVNDDARALEMLTLTPADRCYVIFFTARSGSTWLTSLLSLTGELGYPEEYLNPNFVRNVSQAMHARTQEELLEMLRRRRKTPNGVFGIEVRHIDVELFSVESFFAAFDPCTVFFYLWRDNIVAQGISLYRAVYTGRYHATDARSAPPPPYDSERIRHWMTHLLHTENRNLELLTSRAKPARFLRYEDILRDPRTTAIQFADALGIVLTQTTDLNQEKSEYKKIGDDWNREVEATFRRQEIDFVLRTESARLIRLQPGEDGWNGIKGASKSLR